jgi:hypothetical protein
MDSAQGCGNQAAECIRLKKSAPTKDQARLLENISISWSRLAGQIDRYNELVRKRGCIDREARPPLPCTN